MPSKIATRSSLEQVATIDRMLQRQHGATIAEMAEVMDCHPKTVRRHIAWMRNHFELRISKLGFGPNASYVYPLGQSSIFTREATRRMA
jgi:DeoR/GlpR family transcriptional regulator of sugar metabolism